MSRIKARVSSDALSQDAKPKPLFDNRISTSGQVTPRTPDPLAALMKSAPVDRRAQLVRVKTTLSEGHESTRSKNRARRLINTGPG